MFRLITVPIPMNLLFGSRRVFLLVYVCFMNSYLQAPIVADVKTDVDSIFKFAASHMTEEEEEDRNEEEGEEEEL